MPVMEKENPIQSLEQEQILEYARKIQQNNTEDKKFADSLDRYLQNKERTTDFITVGKTPNALSLAGADTKLNIVIAPRTIAKCMSEADKHYHGHGLSDDIMKQIPLELRNPTMIFKGNKDNSLVAITALKDKENREIMIAVSLSERENRHEVNRVSSIYGRNNMTNYLKAQIDQGNLIAANTEKANEMLQSAGLQLPLEETFISFNNSIAYTTQNVKYPEQENSEITHFHNPVEHNKLLPILNAKADFHESRLETLKDKRDKRTTKIERNEVKITKLSLKADKLEDLNKMFSSLSERSNVFKAIVARNEQKINAIRNEKIPARQQKIKNHQNRIAEIDRKSEIIGHKLERCVALSDTVKSFAVIGAERRQRFATAMDKLNQSTLACLNDKKAALIDKLESQTQKYNAPETAISAKSDIQNSINKCNTQISDLDNKISTLSQNHATYAKKSEAEIDTVMQNTANAVQASLETGEINVAAISEKACLTATQENPFEYLKNAEMAMEDDYNSIDGIINNGKRDEPPQENNISQSETDKGTNTVEDTKEKRYINPDYYKSLKAAVSAADIDKLNDIKNSIMQMRSQTVLTVSKSDIPEVKKIHKDVVQKRNDFVKHQEHTYAGQA